MTVMGSAPRRRLLPKWLRKLWCRLHHQEDFYRADDGRLVCTREGFVHGEVSR